MADDFTKWQRELPRTDREPYSVKWKASHLNLTRTSPNPYKREAARDRKIFLWVMTVVVILGIVSLVAWLMLHTSGNAAAPE